MVSAAAYLAAEIKPKNLRQSIKVRSFSQEAASNPLHKYQYQMKKKIKKQWL